jgi:hypothetical protein
VEPTTPAPLGTGSTEELSLTVYSTTVDTCTNLNTGDILLFQFSALGLAPFTPSFEGTFFVLFNSSALFYLLLSAFRFLLATRH